MSSVTDLDPAAGTSLAAWVERCVAALGDDLRSIVLFGSAAEGRRRALSDLNLLVVLRRFDRDKVDGIRDAYRTAQATARVEAMFVLDSELPQAAEAFAVKFADILTRRRVLVGDDPLVGLAVPPTALAAHARQVLLNLRLRLRHGYVLSSLREEQVTLLIAESAGPLRAAAAAIAKLEGRPATSPKAALAAMVESPSDAPLADAVRRMSEAREQGALPPGVAGAVLFDLMRLTELLDARLVPHGQRLPP